MTTRTYIELGDLAQGTIEASDAQATHLDELTEHIRTGEFSRKIVWDGPEKMTIARCVDGRRPAGGMNPLAPNAAGGTETLFVADDLTAKRFASVDDTTVGGYANVVAFLKTAGFAVGGHTDTHAAGDASGCGANDKLPLIYAYIAAHGEQLRSVAATFGVAVSDATHEMIVSNAEMRTQFSKGAELLAILKENTDQRFFDELAGDHQEVVAYLNTTPGTTLDRDALAREFSDAQAFCVDVWAMADAARVIATSDEDAAQKVAAMAYYNLATACVLSGPRMRVTATNFTLAA